MDLWWNCILEDRVDLEYFHNRRGVLKMILIGVTNYFSIKNGIYAIVHNRTSFPLIKYQGVFVSTGVATNIVNSY